MSLRQLLHDSSNQADDKYSAIKADISMFQITVKMIQQHQGGKLFQC